MRHLPLFMLFVLLLLTGCSSSKSNPVEVPDPMKYQDLPNLADNEINSKRTLLGVWRLEFNTELKTAGIVPDRELFHTDVTSYIPQPVIAVNEFNPDWTVDIDVTLENNSNIDAYDVRLIIFQDYSPPRLLNPDNWTTLYDIPGGYDYNPFKAYAKTETNRIFAAHTDHTENLLIQLKTGSYSVQFAVDASANTNCVEPYEISNLTQETLYESEGTAIVEVDVYDWQNDCDVVYLVCSSLTGQFLAPMTKINDTKWTYEVSNLNSEPPGEKTAIIVARNDDYIGSFDLYNVDQITVTQGGKPPVWDSTVGITNVTPGDGSVTVEWGTATDEQAPPVNYLIYKDTDDDPFDQVPIVRTSNDPIAITGLEFGQTYWFGVRCADSGNPWNIDDNTVVLSTSPTGPDNRWVKTWGGENGYAHVLGMDTDDSGNYYCSGHFGKSLEGVDFDPGEGEEIQTAIGNRDAYFSCFDSDGNFIWVRTWGGYDWDIARDITVDGSGNIYLTGIFEYTVDFDPGPGVEERTALNNLADIFLVKYNANGDFLWVCTWGSRGHDYAYGVTTDDNGNVYVSANFWEVADFDPGPDVDFHISVGEIDHSLSKFDPNGNFEWARTWGGEDWDQTNYLCVYGSYIYVAGAFSNLVDFDPGPGVDQHTSHYNNQYDRYLPDSFLCKYDSNGNYLWVRTWGGESSDAVQSVTTDLTGYLVLTGIFGESVDFDPGTGIDEHVTNGKQDAFLSRFDNNGNFLWARTWGGLDSDLGEVVITDEIGNIMIAGRFYDSADFNPDAGQDIHTSNGFSDVFLSEFTSNGNFIKVLTWGGDHVDNCTGILADNYGNIFAAGDHRSINTDFDPGPGIDQISVMGDYDAYLMKFIN